MQQLSFWHCCVKEICWLKEQEKRSLFSTWFCCIFSSLPFVDCWLSGVGFGCRVYLLVVVLCCWLSGVGCRVLIVDFMYLRAIFCTFQISVDFHYVPVGAL